MKKTAFLLTILTLCASGAFAQSQQFGFLFGGSKRLVSHSDEANDPNTPSDNFKFSNSVKEAWYAVEIDQGTMFRIKLGQITAPVAFQSINAAGDKVRTDVEKGSVDHVDALVDYRFSEPFGSTGLFAGVGLYRQTADGFSDETNYGFSGGVNGDFPLSRRYGIIVEGTYHWVNYHYRPRYITATAGLRISF